MKKLIIFISTLMLISIMFTPMVFSSIALPPGYHFLECNVMYQLVEESKVLIETKRNLDDDETIKSEQIDEKLKSLQQARFDIGKELRSLSDSENLGYDSACRYSNDIGLCKECVGSVIKDKKINEENAMVIFFISTFIYLALLISSIYFLIRFIRNKETRYRRLKLIIVSIAILLLLSFLYFYIFVVSRIRY
mgnify:CR=1 FL=1|jgi:hypothetical protein